MGGGLGLSASARAGPPGLNSDPQRPQTSRPGRLGVAQGGGASTERCPRLPGRSEFRLDEGM